MSKFLRSSVYTGDSFEIKLLYELIQKSKAFLKGIIQDDLQLRKGNFQSQSGKSGSGSDIDESLSRKGISKQCFT